MTGELAEVRRIARRLERDRQALEPAIRRAYRIGVVLGERHVVPRIAEATGLTSSRVYQVLRK